MDTPETPDVDKVIAELDEIINRTETIQFVREGIASANRNEGRPMDEMFDELDKELHAETNG